MRDAGESCNAAKKQTTEVAFGAVQYIGSVANRQQLWCVQQVLVVHASRIRQWKFRPKFRAAAKAENNRTSWFFNWLRKKQKLCQGRGGSLRNSASISGISLESRPEAGARGRIIA